MRILHFPTNSGHIGILPSEIGFAFPFSACFIARVRDLRFDAPAEQWMDVERDEKFGNATDTQLPSMRVCGDECIISTPIIFYRWNETLHVEDIYPMPQLPHLHLFQDKCALQRQFPANSNFAGFFPTFQYTGTICLASRVHLDSDLISEKTGRLPS